MSKHRYSIEIEAFDNRGSGQGTITYETKKGKRKNQRISVPYTMPGEIVQAEVIPPFRKKIARLLEIEKAHENRIEPSCKHFGKCGGCSWQHFSYHEQLQAKTAQVKQYLREQDLDDSLVIDTIGADDEWHYRNKMEFTFSAEGELGLHEKDNYRKIIPLEMCQIASEEMVNVAMAIADWAKKHQLSGYDKETHVGLLRHLMIRHSRATGEIMLALFATEAPDNLAAVDALKSLITTKFPQVKSLMWLENRDVADRAQAEKSHTLLGRDYIYDELAGYRYRLWFDTFFQTNPEQAEKLVELALAMGQPEENEKMIDLFCGVGTFSLPFAKRVEKLIGIEIVETSIESAIRNATDNGIFNTEFLARDARRGLAEVLETFGKPDLLLIDPPRSGAGGKVMRRIGRTEPSRVVYVSCNPESFAVDVKQLGEFGYKLVKVQPVDLFPQTYHVELVALMSRVDE